MAVDSIIAKPTNKVLVMVADASGCWARAVRADATAFPSPKAGNIQPILVVNPAVTIEAMAMMAELSIVISLVELSGLIGGCWHGGWLVC